MGQHKEKVGINQTTELVGLAITTQKFLMILLVVAFGVLLVADARAIEGADCSIAKLPCRPRVD